MSFVVQNKVSLQTVGQGHFMAPTRSSSRKTVSKMKQGLYFTFHYDCWQLGLYFTSHNCYRKNGLYFYYS